MTKTKHGANNFGRKDLFKKENRRVNHTNMATRTIIKESLQILDMCGLKPGNQNIRTRLRVLLQIVINVFFLTENVAELTYNSEELDFIDGINELAIFYQILFKMFVILVYEQVLGRLLFRIGQFWPLDRYGSQFKLEILHLLTSSRQTMKIFFALFCISAGIYLSKPLFYADRLLPLLTYHPTDLSRSPQYELMYCLEISITFAGCLTILSFDILFISCILHIITELKLVKKGFLTINCNEQNEKTAMQEIRELIEHHNLVLECIKDLDNVYTYMLLNQFLSSLVCICGGLLSLANSGFPPDLEHCLKYIAFLSTILSQLFIYCSAGSYLITESESVSEAVYGSDWWAKTQAEIRRAYVLVIQRANKTEKLTAGGMFVLNLESFTNVVKTSLSFFTLVQALYSRTEQNQI